MSDLFNGWPEDGEPVTTLSDEEMVAWANANIDRVQELERLIEILDDSARKMLAKNERLTARNEHLEKRFGYLEGDWERRNHIIAGLTAENERLTAVVEASKDYLSDHSNESEQSLFEALAAVEEKDDE